MTANLPTPNLGGTDWSFSDPDGNEFVISEDGSITCDFVDWIDLSPQQWRRIATIAAYFAEEH